MTKLNQLRSEKSRRRPVHSGLIDFLSIYDEDQQNKAIKYFTQCYCHSRDWRASYREKWIEYYELYRSYSRYYEGRPDWQSQYFISKIFTIIEAITSRIVPALYDTPPLMVAIPNNEDSIQAAKSVEMLLDTRAVQTGQFFTDYQTIKSMLIYGTAIQK